MPIPAINVTFGGSVEATVICNSSAVMSLMHLDFYEQIKALPNAKDIILEERESEYKYQGLAYTLTAAPAPKQKILKAVSLNAVISGAPVVLRFHIVKNSPADGLLASDFYYQAIGVTRMAKEFFEWRHGSRTIRTNYLENPKLRIPLKKEDGTEIHLICLVVPFDNDD